MNQPPPNKRHLSHGELELLADTVAHTLTGFAARRMAPVRVYPVPRGGVPAFYLLVAAWRRIDVESLPRLQPVDDPRDADIIFDDLVDSGATQTKFKHLAPDALFMSLIAKGQPGFPMGEWLVFPWEERHGHETQDESISDAFIRLIQYIGEDPTREGLRETPARMTKAWAEWTNGYKADPVAILKTFEDGGELCDEMIHVQGIPFYSQCEHHLAPFFGDVTFAYIPGEGKRIVGLSKMNRLVDAFARRLQVQERLTAQVLKAFVDAMQPKGAACTIRARHLCIESRGVCQQNTRATTSALHGVLKTEPAARAEYFALTQK